ncbi:MAG: hypothetical protein WDN27_03970 [Candidatus Saccharibacteria bacterium]
MEDKLYEKIGKQEMQIEALKRHGAELSGLIAKFIAGEESPENWQVTPQGQLVRKGTGPADVKPAKRAK